ncbi:hypothetical protein L0F63_005188 [Massospora cicadina]|nr:hypothetical protein L0F63_006562 [Massospora cicadina]KAI0228819.1 hypothetical protein L0F63_005188 [Massospora cicadina]
MLILNWNIPEMWGAALTPSHFSLRAQETKQSNVADVWHKRGIAAIPNKFAILFGQRFPYQVEATILIYTSSLGLLSHGGVEIRQGLNANMVQSCSNALREPNASATATSATTASANSNPNDMAIP